MPKKLSQEEFLVKAKAALKKYNFNYDLNEVQYKNMRSKITLVCPKHGSFLKRANDFLRGGGCPECAKEKRTTPEINRKRSQSVKKTNLEKYGVTCPLMVPDIQQKAKETLRRNYGVENPSQSEIIKRKARETFQKHYGVEYPGQSPEIKEKIKKTNLKKYGVPNPMQSSKIQEKVQNTNLEKYGTYFTSRRHFKNISKLTKEFIEEFFVDEDGKISIPEIQQFFNCGRSTAYKYLRQFNIDYHTVNQHFDRNQPAILYYFFDPITELHKIGITCNIKKRFGTTFLQTRDIQILLELEFDTWKKAQEFEQLILKTFKEEQCCNLLWPKRKGGYTEFFEKDIQNEILKKYICEIGQQP